MIFIDGINETRDKETVEESLKPPAGRPLVSVIAISYNQSNFVIETLNSIFNQDYDNIELIISDDASTDGTPSLVEFWLKNHSDRFREVKLLANSENEGICRNFAKGIAASSGSWIKGLACDDLLCEAAISNFVDQTQRDHTELAFSQATCFWAHGDQLQILGNFLDDERRIALFGQPKALLQSIRRSNFLPAAGAFYSRRLFEEVGGIDTSFTHLEDWPLWLRMLAIVERVSWIEKPQVLYRISDYSVSQQNRSAPISSFLYKDMQLFYQKVQREQLTGIHLWHVRLQMLRQKINFEIFGNSWIAHRLLQPLQLLSPLAWHKLAANACLMVNKLRR